MHKKLTISAIVLGIAFTSNTLPDQELKESINRGKEVYATYCQSCHMEDGNGVADLNPPLAKADYLKKPTKTLVSVILEGQTGEVVVNGKKYNSAMPAMDYLDDMQVADVLNYTRNSWGNKIPGVITPAAVKAQRK
jgi:mono/diheme cytochrome c family protein